MTAAPLIVTDVDAAVDAIIARVGKRIVIGLPLGLGKPVELANALYARAVADPTLSLKILTALSLEIPAAGSDLERAFLKPFAERVFAGVPELDYMKALRAQRLPPNVEVCEFFFKPGSLLGNAQAQQRYVSSNYSHAARDVFNQGCNVVAQLICKRDTPQGLRYSLSCNPDTGPELVSMLQAAGRTHCVVGQVNPNLPYMVNDAEVEPSVFDCVIDTPRYHSALFSTPKTPVATPDYAIGLRTSALVRDGGTLQVGIGALGDAVVHALRLRHARTDAYRDLLAALGAGPDTEPLAAAIGGQTPFDDGLYGATEMFVDGLLPLYKDGILKRRVYDFWALQQLINDGRCDPEHLTPDVLDGLESLGVRALRTQDFQILQHHGLFTDATRYEQGHLVAPDGARVLANVADPEARRVMRRCLGTQLRNGIVLHGGFFLGPRDFYQGLHDLSEQQRREICMTGVDKVNQLDLNPRLYQLQRQHARFINTGIMATLSGAVVSDGLDDGRVISGVGGQYNFVAMAHQLRTGRSIILIRAIREQDGKPPSSNIVFNYGHCTIPRHLRDIVVTEYGVADLRSRTDSEVAKALIAIADARFQPQLLDAAQKAGKIEAGYTIPEACRRNLPQHLNAALASARSGDLLPDFPLGSDFTAQEQLLLKALQRVKAAAASTPKWRLLLAALRAPSPRAEDRTHLQRLNLETPRTLQDRVARALLLRELSRLG
ncbi:MAG TPA: acetyl-CoA hydrolase/transferase C-terminal domain-containing protein [Solimonas sp.]